MPSAPPCCSRPDVLDRAGPVGRTISGTLRFARGGGRTFLKEQRTPYPFHTTRPHYLDGDRPDLATLYLQSASGGLYRGDRLDLSIEAGPGALAHVTTQAATVVHASAEAGIELRTRIEVGTGAMLALTSDPYILFPRADLSTETRIVMAPGSSAILAEGFAVHDPAGRDAPFHALATSCLIEDSGGTRLAEDRGLIEGNEFVSTASPLHGYRAFGSVMVLGQQALSLDPTGAEAMLDGACVLGGVTRLPNAAGWAIRLLATDGGALARGLDAAFALCFEALLGTKPARRRK